MANAAEQIPEITVMSLRRQADRLGEEPGATPQSSASSTFKGEENPALALNDAAATDTEAGMSRLERIATSFGARPDCFKNTLQEIAFVAQATVATASGAFLSGTALIITVPVSLDLGMTQGQIAWISASTSYVLILFHD
jgi:hypothetical protein